MEPLQFQFRRYNTGGDETLRGYFITGTDTDVGKTLVSLSVIKALQKKGHIVAAMKPVAAGSDATPQGLRNQDALLLQKQASIQIPYEDVNPYPLATPIAPHIAAQETNTYISIHHIKQRFNTIAKQADFVVVEGAGGWCVPLDRIKTMADLAKTLELHVILVVGMRLGCLNHALLTADAIQKCGLYLSGWVANHIDPNFNRPNENVNSLVERLEAPLIGQIPYMETPDITIATEQLSLPPEYFPFSRVIY